ncbi:MAG TPA: pirin family protein [Gammaproteobacteria bacterium]|nr:pirin family protein [Gammaproteobacteria bacterium]
MRERSVLAVRTAHGELLGDMETRNPLSEPNRDFDPFLILGHHGPQVFGPDNNGMPFDDHPHRGFETVTFVLEGAVVHTDSGGHSRVVKKGGVQWMTAGAGMVHNEQVTPAFLQEGGLLEVLQLWVNLPARLKTTPPSYVGVQANGIVSSPIAGGGGTLHLVSGSYGRATGPIKSLTDVFMSWVDLAAGARVRLPAPHGRTILLYMIRGDVSIAGRTATGGDLIKFADDGDTIDVMASSDAVFLFAHAEPIGEPVAARGPFVMNTEEEVVQAFRDYRNGAFEANVPATEIE